MEIRGLRTTREGPIVKTAVTVDSRHLGEKPLWFSTTHEHSRHVCTERMDGFLVGMLFPAMQYGEDIHLRGTVSRKLLFNVNNYVVSLLRSFAPVSRYIRVTAEQTSNEPYRCTGVGTGFSGGVDSFCTIYDRLVCETVPDYRINAFVFLNVGSHGPGRSERELKNARRKFLRRYEYLRGFPGEMGMAFIPLDSNLHAFHPWGHLKTDTLTSAAGVLMLQRLFARYYYASAGFTYEEQLKLGWGYRGISVADFCDPLIAPLLSTESLDFILDGMQHSRVDKIRRITRYEPVHRYLNVCVGGAETHTNCSVCAKCCRTIMTLKSLGKVESFRHLFDVGKYERLAERRYVREQVALRKTDPFAWGNVSLARERGVRLPHPVICRIAYTIGQARLGVARALIRALKSLLPARKVSGLKRAFGGKRRRMRESIQP